MSEINNTKEYRRSNDEANAAIHAILVEVQKVALDIRDRLAKAEAEQRAQEAAFVRNDLGKADYDGHRRDHITIHDDKKLIQGYKFEITKKVLSYIVIGTLALAGSGLLTKILTLLKSI